MISRFQPLILFTILLFCTPACHIDDTSENPVQRLPFEDFDEFFEDNKLSQDTFFINASENETIIAPEGSRLTFADDSFSYNNETVVGETGIIVKELSQKSDMILMNLPSVSGDELLELGSGIYFKASQDNHDLDLQTSISVKLPISENFSSNSGLALYRNNTGWTNLNNPVIINSAENTALFETETQGWLAGAKSLVFNDLTAVSAIPLGYGTILTDLRGFIILAEKNTVISMDEDVNAVMVGKNNIPLGEEATILIIAMNHFTLFVGTTTQEITADLSLEIDLDEVSVSELNMILKSLD